MRRALLRELGRAGRADAWRAASASQASALAHEHRGVASLAGWRAAAAGARVLQPVLTPPHASLLPPALAVSLHARWNSAAAPPLPPPVVPEAAHAGGLLADAGGGCAASEVATIAGESNFGIASLQYMVEWFHVSCDLPWCVAPASAAVDATEQVAQVARHCGLDVDAAHDDPAAHSNADEEHGEALGAPDRGSGSSQPCEVTTCVRSQLARPEVERLQERMKAQVRYLRRTSVVLARLRRLSGYPRWATPTLLRLSSEKWPSSGRSAWSGSLASLLALTHVCRRHDCHPVKSFVPMLAQAPLFISFFLAIQRMAVLPSFETGGTAWFTNLAIADPMYIMPLLSGATFLATVEVRAWAGLRVVCR